MTSEETFTKLIAEYGFVYGATRREQLQAAAETFPEHPGIQALEAERRVWAGDLAGAKGILDRVSKDHSSDNNLRAVRALLDGYEGDMVTAVATFEDILRQESDNRIALMNLPGGLIQVGREQEARVVLLQVEGTYPDNPLIMFGVFSGHTMMQDFDRAQAIIDRFADDPSDFFCVARARAALRQHDWAASEKWAREAVARNPESRSGWEHLSMLLLNKGEIQEAKSAAMFALELNSRSVPSLRNLAKIATLEGNKAEAAEYERRADIAVPFMKDHNEIRKAITLLRSGQTDSAIKILRPYLHSTNLASRNLAASCALAAISADPKTKGVEKILDELKESEGQSEDYYVVKALHLMTKGQREESLSTLDEGEEKFPNKIQLQIGRLRCLAIADDRDSMEKVAEALLQEHVGSPNDYLGILTQLYSKDMNEMADKFYQQLIRKFPSSTVVSLADSMIALNRGDLSGGLSQLNQLSNKGVIPPMKVTTGSLLKMLIKLPWLILMTKLGLRKKRSDKDRK